MDWRSAHRDAMVAAFELHEELRVDTFFRVDVFGALVAVGLKLLFRPLQTAAALYLPQRSGIPGVIVNANHPLALQRYSAGHELGHHKFNHGARRVDLESATAVRRNSPEERLAEAFSSWFLMPPEAAEACMGRLGLDSLSSPAEVYALALRLGVSYTALCTHLPSLKLIPSVLADEWRRKELKTIKQELHPEPPPGGWHNDIWVVVPGDAEGELVVRAGDRLLFGDPEIQILSIPEGCVVSNVAARDLFDGPLKAVDVPTTTATNHGQVVACTSSGSETRWSLGVERPRLGRYVPIGSVRA